MAENLINNLIDSLDDEPVDFSELYFVNKEGPIEGQSVGGFFESIGVERYRLGGVFFDSWVILFTGGGSHADYFLAQLVRSQGISVFHLAFKGEVLIKSYSSEFWCLSGRDIELVRKKSFGKELTTVDEITRLWKNYFTIKGK